MKRTQQVIGQSGAFLDALSRAQLPQTGIGLIVIGPGALADALERLDTQLKRLGSPNFTHLPINAPRCPVMNFQQDGTTALAELAERAQKDKVKALLAGEADANDSYIEINAGAGGTESQDWAEMLQRMYTRWAERHGYKVELMTIMRASRRESSPPRCW